jgi:hypothetical protein
MGGRPGGFVQPRWRWQRLGMFCAALALTTPAVSGCGDAVTVATTAGGAATPRTDASPPSAAALRAAREAGRLACRGKTPLQAAHRYLPAAKRAGVRRHFATLVADPPAAIADSSGYPRLVAALYATTVPGPERREAAAGCAEELAAPGRGRKAPSNWTGNSELPPDGGRQQKGNE